MITRMAKRGEKSGERRPGWGATSRAATVLTRVLALTLALGWCARGASGGDRTAPRGMPVQFRPASQTQTNEPSPAGSRADVETQAKSTRPASAPLPLAPSKRQAGGDREVAGPASALRGGLSTFGSLCLIVGAGASIAWIVRRQSPAHRGRLPTEVVESLGTTALNPRLEVHMLRVGGKLLLVGATASSVETLLEIDDADEVARLSAACHAHRAPSVGASVRHALARLDNETPAPGTSAPRGRRFSTGVADA